MTPVFAPAIDMAQTHADQLRRDAVTWRERRQARTGAGASPEQAPRHRTRTKHTSR